MSEISSSPGIRWLEETFGLTRYAVPLEQKDEFAALVRRLEAIYAATALSWSVWPIPGKPDEWIEHAPQFREQADMLEAARLLEAQPGLLEGLRAFLAPKAEDGWVSHFVVRRGEYEPLAEIGTPIPGPSTLPMVPAQDMTPAMKLANRLAAALERRINPHLPPGYVLKAEQEQLSILDDGRVVTYGTLVDRDVEDAITWVLDWVQDELAELTTVPWPHEPSLGYVFHEPQAETRAGVVQFWFGPSERPVLRFEPIPLAQLSAHSVSPDEA